MEMRLVEELLGQRYRSYQPANDTVALGLLVAQQNAAYCTSIYILVLIHQNPEDLETIKEFHQYAVSRVLKVGRVEFTDASQQPH